MLNQAPTETRVEATDIKEYLAVLLKRKWLILVCFLLSMAGTTAFLFTRQPIYRATARLLVTVTGSLPTADTVVEESRTFFSTQLSIMQGQTMLRRVQQRMKKTPDEIRENLANLKVSLLSGSSIILVAVDSPSKEFARDFANTLAQEYLLFRDEERARSAENALLTLTREANRLGQEVKAAQERYLAYATEHNLPLLKDTSSTWKQLYTHHMSNYVNLRNALNTARAKLTAIEESNTASFIALMNQGAVAQPAAVTVQDAPFTNEAGVAVAAAPAVRPSEPPSGDQSVLQAVPAMSGQVVSTLMDLEGRRVKLEARLAELVKIYKPKFPAIQSVLAELNEIKNSTQHQMRLARDIQVAEVAYLQRQVESAEKLLREADTEMQQKSRELMGGDALSEDLDRVRSQHRALLNNLYTIDARQGFRHRNVSVLEAATVDPDPVYPKKTKGLMVAAFFGLGLGLALAFFVEYIDDSIKLAEEVERDLQLPFLGMIPAAQWNPDDLSAHRLDRVKQQGGVAEAYRVVRSAIIFSIPREKLRSLLLTSAVPREGKTTTCVNLSIGFAQIEERVLLIDADLRRGEIHKYFNLDRDKGLSDVLLGEATPEEAIRHTEIPKLDVLPCGPYPSNPAELLLGWRLKEMMDWARQHYDRIIVDTPPVMGIADSAILGAVCDGTLFIIWAGRTSRRYVRVAKMTAISRGAKIFGFILNNLEPGRVGYYHYYPYYYSYYSRGYYYAHRETTEAVATEGKAAEVPAAKKKEEDEIEDVY
ncbi:MAG: polysaccharide biosynthesis tyrosine autokinase [Verrucomicrobia bacterium]|nr:polysaccharide biosynthesis tyrosine autokinase [Verrucomicrobiota bacterium]